MKEKSKAASRRAPTVITVQAHYVGTESMAAVFERVLISLYQREKHSDALQNSENKQGL